MESVVRSLRAPEACIYHMEHGGKPYRVFSPTRPCYLSESTFNSLLKRGVVEKNAKGRWELTPAFRSPTTEAPR